MSDSREGASLLELLVFLIIFGIVSAVSLPMILHSAARIRVELAAQEIAGVLHLARISAVRGNAKVAVKFGTAPSGQVTYALYRDANGNGVRNREIVSGLDPEIRPPVVLSHFGRRVRFGFPRDVTPPRDPGNARKRLSRLDDPIRFNRSDLASFNPDGSATPGSVYLTDGVDRLAVVRINNISSKITIRHYDFEDERWR